MKIKKKAQQVTFFSLDFMESQLLCCFPCFQDYLREQVTYLFQYYKNMTDSWTKVPNGHMDQ